MKKFVTFLAAAVLAALMSAPAMAEGQLNITSCTTDGSSVNVSISGTASGDDGNYYLFELKPWEDSIGSRTDYAVSAAAGETILTTSLNHGSSNSRLNSKFAVAVHSGSGYTQVSNVMYITNPEACASSGHYTAVASKKGFRSAFS